MPIYDYECPNCGIQRDIWAKIDEEEKLCGCMLWMKRIISATRGNVGLKPYWDENLGPEPVYVTSSQHRKELMRERGLVDKYMSTTTQRWV